jgi:predicted GIY-YIG superfamily endonuclease
VWGDVSFEGGYQDPNSFRAEPGIYMVYANKKVMDIGESDNVRNRLLTHNRKDCWQRNSSGSKIHYAVNYMPNSSQEQRIQLEQKLRDLEQLPCGER